MASLNITTNDPVAEIGRRIALLQAAIAVADDLHDTAGVVDRTGFGMAEDHLLDLLGSEAEVASGLRATTDAGAIVHLSLALADVERLTALAVAKDRVESNKINRRIHRCLYSVLNVLIDAAGEVSAELGAAYFMPAKGNPHDWVDRAIAAAGAE